MFENKNAILYFEYFILHLQVATIPYLQTTAIVIATPKFINSRMLLQYCMNHILLNLSYVSKVNHITACATDVIVYVGVVQNMFALDSCPSKIVQCCLPYTRTCTYIQPHHTHIFCTISL